MTQLASVCFTASDTSSQSMAIIILQVLRPIEALLKSPQVYASPQLTEEAREAVKDVLQPIFALLEGSIKGNRSGEVFRRKHKLLQHNDTGANAHELPQSHISLTRAEI